MGKSRFLFACTCLLVIITPISVFATISTSSIGKTTATVTWTIPSDVDASNITSYNLTYGSNVITISNPSTTSYEITGLSSGTAYTICYVIGLNDGSSDTPSNACVSFYSTYDPWNKYAIAAIAIGSFIVLVLLVAKGLEVIIKPDEKEKKEYDQARARENDMKNRDKFKNKVANSHVVIETNDINEVIGEKEPTSRL